MALDILAISPKMRWAGGDPIGIRSPNSVPSNLFCLFQSHCKNADVLSVHKTAIELREFLFQKMKARKDLKKALVDEDISQLEVSFSALKIWVHHPTRFAPVYWSVDGACWEADEWAWMNAVLMCRYVECWCVLMSGVWPVEIPFVLRSQVRANRRNIWRAAFFQNEQITKSLSATTRDDLDSPHLKAFPDISMRSRGLGNKDFGPISETYFAWLKSSTELLLLALEWL